MSVKTVTAEVEFRDDATNFLSFRLPAGSFIPAVFAKYTLTLTLTPKE